MSTFLPRFLQDLSNPSVTTVLLTGCGGGFDFVHSLTLIPELKRLGKSFIIGSYSFGDPDEIEAEVIFTSNETPSVKAKKVYSTSRCSSHYCPEVAICSFLDAEFPSESPHFVYAYYARSFSVPILKNLHESLINLHQINGIILIDGGSDSLMKGNEAGLGDPVEDAVSVCAVAEAPSQVIYKCLISIGIGADRFNDVSDCSTLRAIAEISMLGGFLGSVSLEESNEGFRFYKRCLDHIYTLQSFRSVLSGSIVAATQGYFADRDLPDYFGRRVSGGTLFIWPIMAMLWAFDVSIVARRSSIVGWIRECRNASECNRVFDNHRARLYKNNQILEVEELPLHVDYSIMHQGTRNKRK